MVYTMVIEIYVDGGCWPNPGSGGWACILKIDTHLKELSGHCDNVTNNQMELEAISQALLALKENAKDYEIIVYSDSQWAINASRGTWNIKKNLDQVNKIRQLIIDKSLNIKWEWIKGHNGHEYNERCDVLAQEQVKNGTS